MSATEALLQPVLIGCAVAPEGVVDAGHIGFKAHNLARMASLALPVPPAFVLGTGWCAQAARLQAALWRPALAELERAAGLRFGDERRPLLLSVRSGAPVSMPGMLETLLNIGLTEGTLPGLLRLTGNPRLVWDAYRRLVAGYGEIVMNVPARAFAADLHSIAQGLDERELDFRQLRELAALHCATVLRESGEAFPQDTSVQLAGAIRAVFDSWSAEKARTWRAMHDVPEAMGTAVTVQRMVFGNAGGTSGAGVGFTRHPSTGERQPWVDFLFDAQGEDVVSGRRVAHGHEEFASVLPEAWKELLDCMDRLERGMKDMQDFEFTVEEGRLYLLQTRAGKRTPQAAARIALDLCDEGVIDRREALERTRTLDGAALSQLQVVQGDGQAPLEPLARAVSACTGVATGPIALDEAAARACAASGHPAILVRAEAETADIAALECAAGLLTMRGARTSHAAVVARQLGKVCLVGCEALDIDLEAKRIRIGSAALSAADTLSLDGNTGCVYAGEVRTVRTEPAELMRRLEALRAAA